MISLHDIMLFKDNSYLLGNVSTMISYHFSHVSLHDIMFSSYDGNMISYDCDMIS